MFKYLMLAGLALFLPGLYALGYSVFEGPSAWMVDSRTFWGTPISLFVFWIGIAHAGTLLSAIFLSLNIKLDRRTALIAELSTLVSLVFAAIFPLMHLGVIDNFYMVVPFIDARGNLANVRSPLVWDFCCIAVYALLSLLFFAVHLKSRDIPLLERYRKPFAWLLFPLVLWVHTIVSLDFATTFVPEWKGAFFPLYFIAGAIYSGLALVNLLLCTEGYRVRLLERIMLACSWMMMGFWLWEFLIKGTFCVSAFIFAGVLPQLRMISVVRERRVGRIFFSTCALIGLFLERYDLVSPSAAEQSLFGRVDLGLVAFSVGGFMLLFFGLRRYLTRFMEGEGTYFGEVDGSDMVMIEEEAEREASEQPRKKKRGIDFSYIQPWSSNEYKVLRIPLLVGLVASLGFVLWVSARLPFVENPYENVEIAFANIVPLIYPVAAFVTALALLCKIFYELKQSSDENHVAFVRRFTIVAVVGLLIAAALAGAFYAGGASEKSTAEYGAAPLNVDTPIEDSTRIKFIWNARCAECHGIDGLHNEKFVREFYPVPQKLNVARIDSLGLDSLANVVLHGRANMNAYWGRLTESEVRGLVAYMRQLAKASADASQKTTGEAP